MVDLYLQNCTLLHVLLRDNITVPYITELTSGRLLQYSAKVGRKSVDEQFKTSLNLVWETKLEHRHQQIGLNKQENRRCLICFVMQLFVILALKSEAKR
jgi:hypothetical protein